MSEKKDRFQITELMLVKADWSRTFIGSIRREIDGEQSVVRGAVKVDEGVIYSMAGDQDELCRNMDTICMMKLDYGLHQSAGIFIGVCGSKYFLNWIDGIDYL